MTDIRIEDLNGKFALSVDGVYQDIEGEADLVTKLLALGFTKGYAELSIGRLKETQKPVKLN
jgi:Fe2+ transport system protein FeoA